nr:30S ribosomal protein S20 [Gammaproteobacteria bacterium]
MANSQQAERRARQAENQRKRNVAQRSMMRTYLKKVIKALDSGDRAAAEAAYQTAVPIVDRMANRGLIHKNKAARHKSRLNARILATARPAA